MTQKTCVISFFTTVFIVNIVIMALTNTIWDDHDGEFATSPLARGVFTGVKPAAFQGPSADHNVSTYLPMGRSETSRSVSRLEAFRKGTFNDTALTFSTPGVLPALLHSPVYFSLPLVGLAILLEPEDWWQGISPRG